MRLLLAFSLFALAASGDEIQVFGRKWTVPAAADWKVDAGPGGEVLRLAAPRGPLPGARRPIQFALADTASPGRVTVEADMRPTGGSLSLLIIFAYRDAGHFDYAHVSRDTAGKEPHHNGIFHVYGGERVRISPERGPSGFDQSDRWRHVVLVYDPGSGVVRVTVDGIAIPALEAVDVSLGAGRVGIGSFDETGEFRNVRIGP